MINLLSDKAQQSLRVAYYVRLATVAAILFSLAILAGMALLAPSYFLALSDESSAKQRLDSSNRALAAQGAADEETLARISEQSALMKELPRSPRIAEALFALSAKKTSGIVLSKISITPDTNSASVLLSGTAKTRNDLLAFTEMLKSSPSLSGVVVPLSQLANETNIPFTLSFSFTKRP